MSIQSTNQNRDRVDLGFHQHKRTAWQEWLQVSSARVFSSIHRFLVKSWVAMIKKMRFNPFIKSQPQSHTDPEGGGGGGGRENRVKDGRELKRSIIFCTGLKFMCDYLFLLIEKISGRKFEPGCSNHPFFDTPDTPFG